MYGPYLRRADWGSARHAATRLGKMKSDERRLWREQAAAMGWSHDTVLAGVAHEKLSDDDRYEIAYDFAAR